MLENEDIEKIIARQYGDISENEKQRLFKVAKALDDFMGCFLDCHNMATNEQA